MSPFRLSRRIAIGMSLGLAACMTLPAMADTVTVSFQANNPWTQEVGTVDRQNDSHDYSVAVAAGKTLQINLVTRDPNVFFKVRNQTTDQQLVDTYQTGATTWSTPNTSAATYTIHVYVDPDAMQRGEEAKYALQIGAYGAQDMQVATTTVTFQDNQPWAQEASSADAQAPAHDYTVAVAAGKTLQVNLITQNPNVHFKVKDQNGSELVDTAKTNATTWSTVVPAAGSYTIDVYVDPTAIPPGRQARYALQVGQFAGAAGQPGAPAGTATSATPAAGSSAANAMTPTAPTAPTAPAATSAAPPAPASSTHR